MSYGQKSRHLIDSFFIPHKEKCICSFIMMKNTKYGSLSHLSLKLSRLEFFVVSFQLGFGLGYRYCLVIESSRLGPTVCRIHVVWSMIEFLLLAFMIQISLDMLIKVSPTSTDFD